MFKVKLQFPKFIALLLVVCISFFIVYMANSQRFSLNADQSQTSAQATSKSKLANDVLIDMGIAKRYDMHFDHLTGVLLGNPVDIKFQTGVRKLFAQEIGWKQFKDFYAARLEVDFSDDELKELLNLAQKPVIKKLLDSEAKVYTGTSKQRSKIGYELWYKYNEGKIDLPSD